MEKRPILLFVGLLAATAVLADAYKWIDEDGIVTYSDRQQPGAERIDLRATSSRTSTYTPTPVRRSQPATQEDEQPKDELFRYESLVVSNPGAEVTLWDLAGTLNVSVAVTPALQGNHQIRVYMDGGEPQVVGGLNFQLDEVWRGVHNIQVEVIDQTGKLMIRSQPNRFYVQQNMVR
jgi:hypothetical protein